MICNTAFFSFLAIVSCCMPVMGMDKRENEAGAPKSVLLTGGAGFIGSHVNKMLTQHGYKTYVLDNLSRGNQKAVLSGEFIQGDLEDREFLDRFFSENSIDVVIHLAAFTDVGESCRDPLIYYRNNVVNTLNLLEAMTRHGVSMFIFSSTAAIFAPSTEPIAEDHLQSPLSPYGQTKLMVEHILRDLSHASPFRYCALRYFNVVGGDPDGLIKNYKVKETNLVAVALKGLKNNEHEFTVFGSDYPTADGSCVRDFIHVWDLAKAHLLATEQLLSGGNSCEYNLGSGTGFSVLQVLQTVQEVTGKPLYITLGERRPGDAPISLANPRKAENELGWKAQFTLRQMIEDSWKALPN